jgi:ribose transport system ATP-binding protein
MLGGRRHARQPPRPSTHTGAAVAVRVEGLSGKTLYDASFEIHEAETVGVAGLLGSGFEEIPYLMFGARPAAAGRIRIGSREHDVASMTPARAMSAGMALIPADRAADGSVGTLSVADNVTMTTLRSHQRLVKLDRGGLMRSAHALGERFDVRPNDPRMAYSSLSGGNQQKVLLAKWFDTRPSLLLLHEPTQGVDVGARHQIYAMLRDAVKADAAILCASSDYEQLALLCDRVLVFARGRLFTELSGDQLTKERITAACLASVSVRTTSPHETWESVEGAADE